MAQKAIYGKTGKENTNFVRIHGPTSVNALITGIQTKIALISIMLSYTMDMEEHTDSKVRVLLPCCL